MNKNLSKSTGIPIFIAHEKEELDMNERLFVESVISEEIKKLLNEAKL